jgi:methionyl-tRNA synthetase
MIMLSPFAPETMEKLRLTLNLPETSLSIDELGSPISPGHKINEQVEYFPAVEE